MAETTKVSEISDQAIKDMLIQSVEKVFSTMLSLSISFKNFVVYPSDSQSPMPISPIPEGRPIVAGSVGFIGSINGVMYVYLDEDLAKRLTSSFLGMELQSIESEGPETVNDALGEITNMTVGTFKNQLCDMGFNCRLTIPSILRGNHFAIESTFSSKIVRTSYRFETLGTPYVVDLLMKRGD
ncbi:MAG: hypothetical protein A2007_03335 [Verrucomicrobia bacterium GWC2_42_7]|nr:MAG: hypothetical protein A2007_03335 [Verrucomicrobia bacterium GWC2_42_7]